MVSHRLAMWDCTLRELVSWGSKLSKTCVMCSANISTLFQYFLSDSLYSFNAFVSAPKCRDLVLGSYVRVDVRSPKFNHHVHKLKSLQLTKSTFKVYENVNLYDGKTVPRPFESF